MLAIFCLKWHFVP